MIEVCLCLTGLYKKRIVIKTFSEFAEIYINLFIVIDDHLRSSNGLRPASEDLKMAVTGTVTELIKSSPKDVIDECFCHEIFGRAVANSVGILLRIINDEQSKSLKMSAIKILEILMMRAGENQEVNYAERSKKKNQLFSSFLPE